MLASSEETENRLESRHGAPMLCPERPASLPGRRKNHCDAAIELLSIDQSGMDAPHDTTRVDEYRCRLAHDSVCAPRAASLVQCHYKRNRESVDELLHVFRASLLIPAVDADDVQSGGRMFHMQPDELRKFRAARGAPRTPERNDNRMTAKLRELDSAPCQSGKVDLRGAHTWPDGLRRSRGCRWPDEKRQAHPQLPCATGHYNR